MVVTRRFVTGSGSGSGDGRQEGPAVPKVIGQMRSDELDTKIREILHDEVAALFRAQLLKMFGSIKTAMVEYFDERYTNIVETVAATTILVVTAAGEELVRLFSIGTSITRSPRLLMGYRTRL